MWNHCFQIKISLTFNNRPLTWIWKFSSLRSLVDGIAIMSAYDFWFISVIVSVVASLNGTIEKQFINLSIYITIIVDLPNEWSTMLSMLFWSLFGGLEVVLIDWSNSGYQETLCMAWDRRHQLYCQLKFWCFSWSLAKPMTRLCCWWTEIADGNQTKSI